jgi:uncharacterized protein (TIGR00266 family)
MSTWYLSYNGQQFGPFDESLAIVKAQQNPQGFAWKEGMENWLPLAQVPELRAADGTSTAAPPPVSRLVADVIDFKICGSEMQYVAVELDPGESVIAEAGAMMYKSPAVVMQSILGDGSAQNASVVNKLIGAGKRLLTGEGLFMTAFTHTGQGKAHVAFAAPFAGNIIPVALSHIGGALVCQKDSFLCAAKGVSVGIYFQRRILTGLFGGEGFIMQKLEGDGLVFMHAGGTVAERYLEPGETLHVDAGCIVGFQPTVDFQLEQAGGIKTALFGGEGIFVAALKGPGAVWLQSLPFSRLAGRMLMASKGGQEEGSAIGSLGSLFKSS